MYRPPGIGWREAGARLSHGHAHCPLGLCVIGDRSGWGPDLAHGRLRGTGHGMSFRLETEHVRSSPGPPGGESRGRECVGVEEGRMSVGRRNVLEVVKMNERALDGHSCGAGKA